MAGTFTNLLYHIVYSTKHRQSLIQSPLRDELYKYIGGIIRAEKGILLEVGGMPDLCASRNQVQGGFFGCGNAAVN